MPLSVFDCCGLSRDSSVMFSRRRGFRCTLAFFGSITKDDVPSALDSIDILKGPMKGGARIEANN